MLHLLRDRVGWVLTMDHETRAGASTDDAAFVADLCRTLGLGCTIRTRRDLEQDLMRQGLQRQREGDSEWYRKVRLEAYRQEVQRHGLSGVLLAHHADDQAETVAMRLIRGSGFEGLGGMEFLSQRGGERLSLCRPLLRVRKRELIGYLETHRHAYREDASNASDKYARNRVRAVLDEGLTTSLLRLAEASRAYRNALLPYTEPKVEEEVVGRDVGGGQFEGVLGGYRARRWLGKWVGGKEGGGEVSPRLVKRFVIWATDAALGSRFELPGGSVVIRKRGRLTVEPRNPF